MPPYNIRVRSDFAQMSQGRLEEAAEKGTLMQIPDMYASDM